MRSVKNLLHRPCDLHKTAYKNVKHGTVTYTVAEIVIGCPNQRVASQDIPRDLWQLVKPPGLLPAGEVLPPQHGKLKGLKIRWNL